MGTIQTLGTLLGLGLLCGIRLYLLVLSLGLAIRLGFIHLGPKLAHLGVLAQDPILAAAAVLCAVEFIADKVPWVDRLWDAPQTVLRPIGAGIVGALAIGTVNPAVKTGVVLVCAGLALAAHAANTAARMLANYRGSWPITAALSLAADLLVPCGVWLAFEAPFIMLNVVAIFCATAGAALPVILRLMKVEILATLGLLRHRVSRGLAVAGKSLLPPSASARLGAASEELAPRLLPLPERYWRMLEARSLADDKPPAIACTALNVEDLRNSIGYLFFSRDSAFFVAEKKFRLRLHEIGLNSIEAAGFEKGLLMDRLTFRTRQGDRDFLVFKVARRASKPAKRSRLLDSTPASSKAS